MEINVKHSYGFTDIVINAENVNVVESVSECQYELDENGKKDFKKSLGHDITDNSLSILSSALEDLLYYRKAQYDTTSLIALAFDKLPYEKQQLLLKELLRDYSEEIES